MIGIELDSGFLDTQGVKIDLRENSPLFDKSFIPSGYSLPFNIKLNAVNRKRLGLPDVVELKDPLSPNYDCKISFQGMPIFNGVLRVKSVGENVARVVVNTSVGGFADRIQNKTLREFEYSGNINMPSTPAGLNTYMLAASNGTPDTHDFVFAPVENKTAQKERVNIFYPDPQVDVMDYEFVSSFGFEQDIEISPFPYLKNIIQYILEELGYRISGEFWKHEELKNLVLFTNYALVLEYYKSDSNGVAIPPFYKFYVPGFSIADLLPEKSVSELLSIIRNWFNAVVWINKKDNIVEFDLVNDLLQKPYLQDLTDKLVRFKEVSTSISSYKFSTSGTDGHTFDVSNPPSYLTLLPPVSKESDLSGSPTAGDLVLVTQVNTYFLATETLENGVQWGPFLKGGTDLSIGSDGKSFSPEALNGVKLEFVNALPSAYRINTELNTTNGFDHVLPSFDEELYRYDNLELQSPVRDIDLKLMIYRGYQSHINGDASGTYPCLAVDVYGADGLKINGADVALRWAGDHGLYENFWKRWVNRTLLTREVKMYCKLSAVEVFNLDLRRKYRFNGVDYFIKSYKTKLTDSGEDLTELICVKA